MGDCASGTSLLRRSRDKLVLLFHFSSASPRNDGAPIVVLLLAGASFEAARKYDGRGAHRHCEVERVRLSCTSTLNRSNLLEVGNCAKKDLGKGEEVLRGSVPAR